MDALTVIEPVGAFLGGVAAMFAVLRLRGRVRRVTETLDRVGLPEVGHVHEYKYFDRVAPHGRCECGAFHRKA